MHTVDDALFMFVYQKWNKVLIAVDDALLSYIKTPLQRICLIGTPFYSEQLSLSDTFFENQ